ncbi:MAG: tyrosine-protein phosphatase, partial [Ruminococcus sp.]|nr:tyrosine-protein phosphatase [Ruminococcus sp.]
GLKESSKPDAIEFKWLSGAEDDETEYTLSISESKDMVNAETYSSAENSISIYNLKAATTYYWTVSSDEDVSDVSEFTTSGICPRNLAVDGVTNVRDLGGWVTETGKRTKQGLIYRCGRLNKSSVENVKIEVTENGIKTMLDSLKIKTEIDLRKIDNGEIGAITSSPLGEHVNYIACPMEWDGDIFKDNKDMILKLFSILSDEENYPMIFHCNIGTDRTGMVSYLINALLGVDDNDLLKDYLFSNYARIGSRRSAAQMQESGYYVAIHEAEGNSLKEKTYNSLVELGVPSNQLDSVISILSEK